MVRKGDLLAGGAAGAAVNFPWEMAHSLLYRNPTGFTWKEHLVRPGVARGWRGHRRDFRDRRGRVP